MTTMSPSKSGGKTPRKPLSKTDQLKIHILSGKSITGKQALERFGLYRLSAVIFRMRMEGHDIVTTQFVERGEVFAKYQLRNPPLSPHDPPTPPTPLIDWIFGRDRKSRSKK